MKVVHVVLIPVADKYNVEIGARVFQVSESVSVLGNSGSDGFINMSGIQTLSASESYLGAAYPAVGWMHTHPETMGFSNADKLATLRMYQSVNRKSNRPVDFRGYVGLSDGSVREWLPIQQTEGVVND